MDESELYDDYAVEPGNDELDRDIMDDEEEEGASDEDEDGVASEGGDADPADVAGQEAGDTRVGPDSTMEVHGELDLERANYASMMADEDYYANEDIDAAKQRGWRQIDDTTVRVGVNHSIRMQWARGKEQLSRRKEHIERRIRNGSTRPVHRNQQADAPAEPIDEWDLFLHFFGPSSSLLCRWAATRTTSRVKRRARTMVEMKMKIRRAMHTAFSIPRRARTTTVNGRDMTIFV